MIKNGYEDKKICRECGGNCCKNLSGATFPCDFDLPGDKEKLMKALKSGYWTIDWWEGDPREGKYKIKSAYFVRPATIGMKGTLLDGSWGGVCIFLYEKGCGLHFNHRPHNCRFLEPKKGETKCITHDNSKQGAAIAWLPFNKLLRSFKLTLNKG